MKRNFLKTGAFFSLIVLTFSSCFKDDLQEPIGPDPSMWYSNSAVWEETERKSGTADWETLLNGNHLNLLWDYRDASKTIIVGAYKYKPTNFGTGIDSVGYIQIKDGLLSFITVKDGGHLDTTATVEYLNYGDTLLVIRDIAVVPVIEIRYKKIK